MNKEKIVQNKEFRLKHIKAEYISDEKKMSLCNVESNTELDKLNAFSIIKTLYYKSNAKLPLDELIKVTHLSIKTLAGVFEVTPKTLSSYGVSSKNIPIHIIELSLKLNELYKKGSQIFGSTDNFNAWMKKDSYGLGGLKPIEFLNTVTGIEVIFDELISIEFGTTA